MFLRFSVYKFVDFRDEDPVLSTVCFYVSKFHATFIRLQPRTATDREEIMQKQGAYGQNPTTFMMAPIVTQKFRRRR